MNRICHITTVHPRFDVRIFEKQAVFLSKSGCDVGLIVADGKGDSCRNNVVITDVGRPKNRFFRMLFTSFKTALKLLGSRYDIYHFHDPELLLSLIHI